MAEAAHAAAMTEWFTVRGQAGRLVGCVTVAAALAAAEVRTADAQTAPAPTATQAPQPGLASPTWTFAVRDTFRVESWRFFEPRPGGGNPDYTFAGNRLFLQAGFRTSRVDVTLAAQYVALVHLPVDAAGPGALGTGPLYFGQSGRETNPHELYLRYANIEVRDVLPGLDLRVGRQAYASGAEAASGDAAIETLKRQRLDARLVGEFEWSLFQRGFDGIRADWRGGPAVVTGAALLPTQGGFASDAGRTMTDVRILGLTGVLPPATSRPHLELQGFLWRYDDDRAVSGRPDNSGRDADAADVGVTTAGGALIGAWPVRGGRVDAFGWFAAQHGDWYGQDHAAFSLAVEGGYAWTRAPWTPWLRGGWLHASGDDDPADGTHETFFPMLPTMRRFSQTTAYSTMNLRDAFVQLQLRPARPLTLRVDLHRLWLASSEDRWYAGSGATLSTGGTFGYASRPSNGSTDVGTAAELSAAYAPSPRWSINGFAGTIDGGRVVTGTFGGDRLWFAYVESGVRIGGSWR